MQMELIETFLDLCETLSFTATAERLEVTQSTVSARVTTLEDKLGHRLFRRGRAGTGLTPEGARFEPHARALSLAWVDAQRAVDLPGRADLSLRLGFQPDLVGARFGAWMGAVHKVVPEAALYLEAVFSRPMSQELLSGALDLGVLFTPNPHPDLHFEALSDVRYELVASEPWGADTLPLDRYIVPDYSPVFLRLHGEALPRLAQGLVTAGQSNLALPMMQELGGASYQPSQAVEALMAQGFHRVTDAPVLSQPVYGAVHLRNRHRKTHRRVMRALGAAL